MVYLFVSFAPFAANNLLWLHKAHNSQNTINFYQLPYHVYSSVSFAPFAANELKQMASKSTKYTKNVFKY